MMVRKIGFESNPAIFWLTGFSGAGKTTIPNCLIEKFNQRSILPVLLEGNKIRIFQHLISLLMFLMPCPIMHQHNQPLF